MASRHSAKLGVASILSAALLFAGCGGDDEASVVPSETATSLADDPEPPVTTAPDEPEDPVDPDPPEIRVELTASWRGVTSETITVGMSMLDFGVLKDLNLSPAGWGDQQGIWEALIADLNARGGINGRMIEAVYDFYSPISGEDADRSCTVLTQDNETFANLGGYVGPVGGTADVCIVGLNDTIMVGGEITAEELELAKAPWFHASPTVEVQTNSLLNLVMQTGRAEDAIVYMMGGAAAAAEEEFVREQLTQRGIEVVGSRIIKAPDGDTLAQDQELAVAFEDFISSGANTLMLFGTPSAQIRGSAAAGLTGEIAIWSNDSGGLANLGQTISDKSIADGTLTATGPTDDEIFNDPLFQTRCLEPAEAANIPEADFRLPTSYQEGEENWFNPLRRYCLALAIFEGIATAAGPDLTPETFEAAAFGGDFDDFTIPGLGPASLSPTKLGAQDGVRLSMYDHTLGDGGLVPVTELLDAFD